jgi:hypothetical protein
MVRIGSRYPDASLLAESAFAIWSRMFLHVFAVMISIAAYQNEHSLSMWKHLNALPSRGRAQALAKHAILALAAVWATFWLGALALVGSATLHFLKPRFPLVPQWQKLGVGLFVLLIEALSVTSITSVVAARVRHGYVGATLGFGALCCVLGNGLPSNDVFPWSFGDTWSRVLGDRGGMYDLGPYSIGTVVISGTIWAAAAIAVHLQLEKHRPHY